MHRHSSDSTNAVMQFIQMENVLEFLLNGQSVGTFTFASPQPKCWGDVSPRPSYNRRPCVYVTEIVVAQSRLSVQGEVYTVNENLIFATVLQFRWC